ncbi:MAG: DUF1343 domain-containing protein [Fimbriimonadaceae bacterium]|nr:DUF1343 domain-containing protein [Fimbriimonadaceae bacterium]
MAEIGLAGLLRAIAGRRVGLVTGPTGWLERDGHQIDILHARGWLRALFAPEHGVWGDLQAGDHVPGGQDPRTGVPVFSLYGEVRAPTAEMLAEVDVVVGCLQDAGGRPYTYQATLAACLDSCARLGKPLLLLDRPTPLGGVVAQGNVGAGTFFPAPLPMRPALTIGEMLRLYQHQQRLAVELLVVPLLEAPRELWYDELPLPWVAPSPNLPTVNSALCFTATVLLEATNASEGRGTTRPFELIGAPWADSALLADELNRRRLAGVLARPAAFIPTFSKHQGEVCHGVQLHLTDRAVVDPPLLGLHVLDALRRLWPDSFVVRPKSLDVRYHSAVPRQRWEAGEPLEAIAAGWQTELAAFRAAAADAGVGPPWWADGLTQRPR